MVSADSSGESESDGLEFGSGNDHDDNIEDGNDEEGNNGGDEDDNEEEGGSEGDEMEEEEYDGGHRVEMVDGEQSMPMMPIGSADESVGQEPPMADDGMTHFSNASTHVLPSSPSTTADPSLNTLPSGDDVRSQPKRKVQVHILQDQGMSESGGGCVAGHCKEPDWVGEMVLCAGISCSNQVSVIIWDIVRVKVLTSMAVLFDLCANCTCQRK